MLVILFWVTFNFLFFAFRASAVWHISEAAYAPKRSGCMEDASRRQVLGATVTGTALSLAGCSALDDDDAAPDMNGSEGTATIVVDIEARIAEREAEIRQQVEDDELSEEEAQAELQASQVEAIENAIEAVESHAADTDRLNVVTTNSQAGALLVDGDPAAIIETLDSADVAALVSAAQFEQLQEQAGSGD